MARLPRLRIPDYPLHVVVRGNNRQLIFRSDGDRLFFHRTLTEVSRKFGARVHAYVYMPNHVHLLVSGAQEMSVSKTIQSLGRRYVAYFNLIHRRTGTLWEGRFHSSLVDTERYFLACQRYIELNPVRAGMCCHPSEFEWSSHRHYARGLPDDLITRHALHDEHFHSGPAAYCRIFDHDVPRETIQAIRDAVHHGWALGDDHFRARITELSGRRSERLTVAGRPPQPELSEMESDPIICSLPR
jgi:putative transposase